MKGVFDTKRNSRYDDEIARRYHFSGTLYRDRARQMIGDWIVYREPQREGGRRAYVAVARVVDVVEDPTRAKHYYAILDSFLRFPKPVPFWTPGGYREEPLRSIPDRATIGRTLQGHSIRMLAEDDFASITREGLSVTLDHDNFRRLNLDPDQIDTATADLLAAPEETQKRRIEQILVNRKIRDAAFRGEVCDAYDNRCAVTRLRMINGGGRAEVQAAHIRPASDDGPDIVQNGLALSGTAHWLFDRHLISITDDYRLLVSHNKIPEEFRGLLAPQVEQIHLPTDKALWPRPSFLQHHRDRFVGT
ncbi:HNH endonuclease [Sphingomonas sp. CJ20]